MEITWDERKRQSNIKDHGFDFADARENFSFGDALIEPSYPGKDRRSRFIAIGPLNGELVTLVFSLLGTEGLSIISLRRSSRKESKRYEQS